MNTDLAKADSATVLERVVIGGDLASLSPKDRMEYYRAICVSVGLNPLTRPFSYLTLSGRLVLYANRDATDQLRKINGVSIEKLERETVEGVYTVTAYARDAQGRVDSAIGAVPIENLKGEAKANAMMKAETKGKRRVTLSICGLGMLDETETGSIPDARPAKIDYETGEIIEPRKGMGMAEPERAEQELSDFEQAPLAEDPPLNEPLERSLLLTRCKAAADKARLDAKKRADILVQFNIRDPREASIDQLTAMLEHLRGLTA